MRASKPRLLRLGAGELVMVLVALAFAFPAYVFLNVSLKDPQEASASPLALPSSVSLDNYVEAWRRAELGGAMMSSVVVAVISVALLVLLGSFAAYVLARRATRLSFGLFVLFLLGLMIPTQLGMVPLYQLMHDAGMLRTWTSLIIAQVGQQLPLTVFLYAGLTRALPREYEEAAYVDGAGPLTAFRRVVFPMLRPITGTVIVLSGINIWNEFLLPLLYTGGSAQQTLPAAVYSFRGEYTTEWGLLFAGMMISILPVLVGYFLLQKRMMRGFASGLKG
ncbi:sugar ABC transporter permease [Actinophytocola xinjiangensis]|uniref:Sugar ABC transporter permease n=1 Tax=Actinophytocola xinjiangensis TaxID=485602 RepID=A0A7Z0WHS7_9PSEU|nr:carbohydrate ABC transporter permease [Actinophytocola xinjiangensis]OLF07023.1 sugar ABC transporter permease [Actinophytocola xinjiangensis]